MKLDMKSLARHLARVNLPRLTEKKQPKRYPQMVISSAEAIALHNATVFTRQVQRHRARHA